VTPTRGTVLHWDNYFSGHSKFLVVIGYEESTALAFLISSQDHWDKSPVHKREMVQIPQGAVSFLSRKSFIQCFFKVERIPLSELVDALRRGTAVKVGMLRPDYLRRVREVVSNSEILEQKDIDSAKLALT
jgi:hypothetical protein